MATYLNTESILRVKLEFVLNREPLVCYATPQIFVTVTGEVATEYDTSVRVRVVPEKVLDGERDEHYFLYDIFPVSAHASQFVAYFDLDSVRCPDRAYCIEVYQNVNSSVSPLTLIRKRIFRSHGILFDKLSIGSAVYLDNLLAYGVATDLEARHSAVEEELRRLKTGLRYKIVKFAKLTRRLYYLAFSVDEHSLTDSLMMINTGNTEPLAEIRRGLALSGKVQTIIETGLPYDIEEIYVLTQELLLKMARKESMIREAAEQRDTLDISIQERLQAQHGALEEEAESSSKLIGGGIEVQKVTERLESTRLSPTAVGPENGEGSAELANLKRQLQARLDALQRIIQWCRELRDLLVNDNIPFIEFTGPR